MRSHHPARSNADALAHAGQAADAAATAASTSAALPTATVANASPDDGLSATAVPAPPGRQLPPMYSRCSCMSRLPLPDRKPPHPPDALRPTVGPDETAGQDVVLPAVHMRCARTPEPGRGPPGRAVFYWVACSRSGSSQAPRAASAGRLSAPRSRRVTSSPPPPAARSSSPTWLPSTATAYTRSHSTSPMLRPLARHRLVSGCQVRNRWLQPRAPGRDRAVRRPGHCRRAERLQERLGRILDDRPRHPGGVRPARHSELSRPVFRSLSS